MNNDNSVSYWTQACLNFIDVVSKAQSISVDIRAVFASDYHRNSILNIAIDHDRLKFISLLLDYYNIPAEGLTLKQRLALYKLTV